MTEPEETGHVPDGFDCVCGLGFPDLAALQEHWRERAGQPGGPHYRRTPVLGGGLPEPRPARP